eukprot:1990995-Rhodomonas_salina.1
MSKQVARRPPPELPRVTTLALEAVSTVTPRLCLQKAPAPPTLDKLPLPRTSVAYYRKLTKVPQTPYTSIKQEDVEKPAGFYRKIESLLDDGSKIALQDAHREIEEM